MIQDKSIPYVVIDQIDDLVTEVDSADLSSDYALRSRGFRHFKKFSIGERDWGTVHRYPSYPAGITIIKLYTMYVQSENREYEILVGLNSANSMKIYVDDGTGAGNWTELTQTSTGVITTASTTTVNYTTTDTIADLSNWIATVELAPYSALVVSGSSNGATGSVVLANNYDATGSGGAFAGGQTIKLYRYTGILSDIIFNGNPANSINDAARGYRFSNGAKPHVRFLGIQAQQKVTMFYGDSNTPVGVRQQIQIRKGKFQTPNSFTIGGGTGWTAKTPIPPYTNYGVSDVGRAITNASNATPIVVTMGATTDLTNGNTVFISGVLGNTAANGKWVIANVTGTTFELVGSAGSAAYTSGGVLEYGWLCNAGGYTEYSRNGGDSWNFIAGVGTPFGGLKKIRFLDYNNGWTVGGSGTALKMTNGGGVAPSWTSANTGIDATALLNDISIVDANNIFCCGALFAGSTPKVYRTTNGGTSWDDISTGLGAFTIEGIYALSTTNVYVCTQGGQVYHTTNASAVTPTWNLQPNVFGISLNAIKFFDANTGWAVGLGGMIKTINGGTAWTLVTVPVSGAYFFDIDIIDATRARAVGSFGAMSTSDGTIWTLDVFPSFGFAYGIDLVDFTNGFAGGDGGGINRLTGSTAAVATGPSAGWYIDKAGLIPDYRMIGTRTTTRTASSAAETTNIGEGIQFSLAYQEENDAAASGYFVRMYVTALYAGVDGLRPIQESDPIMQLFLSPSALNKFASASITIKIDPSKINKNIVGFRFYEARKRAADVGGLSAVANWAEDSAEYMAVYDALYATPGWALDKTQQFCYSFIANQFVLSAVDLAFAAAPNTILTNLGHFPDVSRTYLTSRFAVKVSRDQGAIVALDQDDKTLRFSVYNGKGVHMDDSFPDLSTDILGKHLIEPLTTRGEMMGLTTNINAIIGAIFTGEMELIDLITNQHTFTPVDCISKESITGIGLADAPAGTVWAGKSAIYFYPSDGSEIRAINANWMNLYDGTLLTSDNATPYINDDFRRACITGYDPTYRDVWFAIQTARENPNAIAITGATNVSPISITSNSHAFATNDLIYISGVLGNTAANGSWIVTKTGANTYTLNGSTGNGAYTSGGTAIQTEILSYRYSVTSHRLSVRRVATGAGGYYPITAFSRRNDNTFTIAHASGILKYPNRDANRLPYEDDVLITTDASGNITAVTSQSRGIDTLLRINLGKLYNLQDIAILAYILMDHTGAVSNNLRDLMNVAFYANDDIVPFTTIQVPIGVPPQRYMLEHRANVKKLKIEITLPAATITQFSRLELNKIQIGHIPRKRIGNL